MPKGEQIKSVLNGNMYWKYARLNSLSLCPTEEAKLAMVLNMI